MHAPIRAGSTPRFIAAAVERARETSGDRERLLRGLERSGVPIVITDRERRYVDANPAARLLLRLSRSDLERTRIDDLTPPHLLAGTAEAWDRLLETGSATGDHEVAGRDGGRLSVTYCAASGALPGLQLIAFAPAGWSEDDVCGRRSPTTALLYPLTPRELGILELAAEGLSGPAIAERLVLSPATVRTHFANIYDKLGIRDRAAAVARAGQLGLIG